MSIIPGVDTFKLIGVGIVVLAIGGLVVDHIILTDHLKVKTLEAANEKHNADIAHEAAGHWQDEYNQMNAASLQNQLNSQSLSEQLEKAKQHGTDTVIIDHYIPVDGVCDMPIAPLVPWSVR